MDYLNVLVIKVLLFHNVQNIIVKKDYEINFREVILNGKL